MKLGHKLLLAPVLSVLTMLAVGQVDAFLIYRSVDRNKDTSAAQIDRFKTISDVQAQLGKVNTDAYRTISIIGSLDDAKQKAFRADLAQQTQGAQRALEGLIDARIDGPDTLTKLTAALTAYAKQADQAVDLAAMDPNTGIAALQTADQQYVELNKQLTEAVQRANKFADDRNQMVAAETSKAHTWFLMVSIATAVLAIWLSWLLLRKVASELNRAKRVAQAVADGDLSISTDTERKDELGDLFRSLGTMQEALNAVVNGIRDTSTSIANVSQEITDSNVDLSNRTEQASSSLQSTASSMEELTATVKQSSEAARQANQLASSAAEVAARGGDVVNQVVNTMDDINASSQKISDIIGVIDSIAFQTNILALNAAVEAARAGEQGRGFAVVAGEVRSLAQRTAEAAKEIKELISASVKKVQGGSKLVKDAGKTMSEIVVSVNRVTDIVSEITAAAKEQSDGIAQVNIAINQLDQMTQQNTGLVNQSTSAADQLQVQAQQLSETVNIFKLPDSPDAATAKKSMSMTPIRSEPAPRKVPSAQPQRLAVPHMPPPPPTPALPAASTAPRLHSTNKVAPVAKAPALLGHTATKAPAAAAKTAAPKPAAPSRATGTAAMPDKGPVKAQAKAPPAAPSKKAATQPTVSSAKPQAASAAPKVDAASKAFKPTVSSEGDWESF